MERIRLKKILKFLGSVVIIIAGINFFLLLTGWYDKKVEGKYGSIYRAMSDENTADRRKSCNVYDYFYVFEGLDMRYKISLYVEKGTVELDILAADGVKMIFDGMEQPVVAQYELTNSDTVYWDLSFLEPGHRYALAVYGSEDSDFAGEIEEQYYIKRWQNIYNEILQDWGKDPKYVP